MLTIKQITENTEAVIRGLEKKHFKNAKETIDQVIAFNDKRRSTQSVLDNNLSEVNSISKSIGQLMKEGKKEEAETAKSRVAELKETNKTLQAEMDQATGGGEEQRAEHTEGDVFAALHRKLRRVDIGFCHGRYLSFFSVSLFYHAGQEKARSSYSSVGTMEQPSVMP